jgi:membrane-associated phospholipid phosphatase
MNLAWITSLSLIFALSLSTSAMAEDLPDMTSLSDFKSPWTTPARPVLLTGLATTGFILLFEDQTDDPTQKEIVEHKPLGKFSPLGDYGGQLIPNAIYALGMLSAHWISKDEKYLHRSLVMIKASAYAVATSTTLKYTIQEPRPNSRDRSSFPSGHATSAFAFASVVVAEDGIWPYGVPALALATLTAVSRINDNQHFLHDVVAGATIGAAFGLGVSYANHDHSKDSTSQWMFIPMVNSATGIFAVHDFP